jgi:hypothetical protein
MLSSHATRAEYYRIGLLTGLLTQEDARAWAMSVIERLTEPPAEIIEVSWSRTQQSLEENLRSVTGERDKSQAGDWLLGLLREKHFASKADLTWCARTAQHVACAAEMSKDVYYAFDGLEDEIFLAKNNQGSDLEACRHFMGVALADYPSPPSPSEA